jgi:hypothetical protein
MVKRNRTNNELQNIRKKTEDRSIRTPLKTGSELRYPEGQALPTPHVEPVVLLLSQTRS